MKGFACKSYPDAVRRHPVIPPEVRCLEGICFEGPVIPSQELFGCLFGVWDWNIDLLLVEIYCKGK